MTQDLEIESHLVAELKIIAGEDVNLPVGTLIDFRFSGNVAVNQNEFSTMSRSRDRVIMLFNKEGVPDRITFGGRNQLIAGDTSFLIRADRDFADFAPNSDTLTIAKKILDQEDSRWVTCGKNSDVFTKGLIKPTSNQTVGLMVRESKELTKAH